MEPSDERVAVDDSDTRAPDGKTEERSKVVVAKVLISLGRFLSDVGELLSVDDLTSTVEFEGRKLPGRYELCDCSKNQKKDDDCCDIDTDTNGKAFCKSKKQCTNSKPIECECHLFRAPKTPKDAPWDHRADPGQSDSEKKDEDKYAYACICVRDTHRGS